MKRYALLGVLLLLSLYNYAQRIEVDILGNLVYDSQRQNYKASLKEDIFHNLIFTDSNNNEITYKEKYISIEYPKLLASKNEKVDFFSHLIDKYGYKRNYKASYSVDIFGKIAIEDNRGNKIEAGNDIFGNPSYEESHNGNQLSIKRDLTGCWQYRSGNHSASLRMDIFKKWNYTDSAGNKLELSENTWNMLMNRFGSEDNIFTYLIGTFLSDNPYIR